MWMQRDYDPALLGVLGGVLLLWGVVVLVFPRPFARLRARLWRARPGEVTAFDLLLARVAGVGLVLIGAICLLVLIVRL
ncbi:hypothetical protein ACEXQD_06255 [Herbiconiux sp. P15]|uniref:hypothetical protein n=1 Tax=Herbiconiux liukaitaii TaxID=3342799 RepID=UPI0035B71B6F